jgi:hypothetical protein
VTRRLKAVISPPVGEASHSSFLGNGYRTTSSVPAVTNTLATVTSKTQERTVRGGVSCSVRQEPTSERLHQITRGERKPAELGAEGSEDRLHQAIRYWTEDDRLVGLYHVADSIFE